MAFLSDDDRRRIEDAIRDIEKQTRGELVAVVARASDSYLLFSLLYATAASLLVPLGAWLVGAALTYMEVYVLQLGLFAIVAALTAWLPVRIWLVPPSFQRHQAARLAREQFYSLRLHETADATGILVFVSVAERYVEILADRGIDAKVSAGVWTQIVTDLTAEIRAGKTGDGFVAALAACGRFLAQHFPPPPGDRNELPDVLIEL